MLINLALGVRWRQRRWARNKGKSKEKILQMERDEKAKRQDGIVMVDGFGFNEEP